MEREELRRIIREVIEELLTEKEFKYATIKRGKQKVTSPKQLAFLHANDLPHTDVYKSKSGKTYKKRDEEIKLKENDNQWQDDMYSLLKKLYKSNSAMDSNTRHIKAAKEIAKQYKIKYQDILKNYTPSDNLRGVKSWDKNGNIK